MVYAGDGLYRRARGTEADDIDIAAGRGLSPRPAPATTRTGVRTAPRRARASAATHARAGRARRFRAGRSRHVSARTGGLPDGCPARRGTADRDEWPRRDCRKEVRAMISEFELMPYEPETVLPGQV